MFIEAVALRTGDCTGSVRHYVNAVLGVIGEAMKNNESVVLPDFGKFHVKRIPERHTVRRDTGEVVIIPEHDKVSFTPYCGITAYADKYKD